MNTTEHSTIEITGPRPETLPSPALETRPDHRASDPIARLPKQTRDMINVMLDDRLPYHILIDELGEAGHGLKPQNLTDWVQGRYQDYLKNREDIEHTRSQMEFAADLLRELGDADPRLIYRACTVLAGLQMFHAIQEYGDEMLRQMLHAKPASYLSLLNTLCNLSNSAVKLEDHRIAQENAGPQS